MRFAQCAPLLLVALLVQPAAAQMIELQNAGFETGALDGWERAVPEEQFAVTDEAAHTGGFALRAHGNPEHEYNSFAHLVQSVDVTPIPGARYEIAGWVRGQILPGEGKSARLSVRQVSADDTTIRYDDMPLKPSPDRWDEVRHRFAAVDGAAHFQVYVILSNLTADDVVLLDDIEFTAIDALGEPVTAEPAAFSGGDEVAPAQLREISGGSLLGQVDAVTGLLASLDVLQPERVTLHPYAADGTIIFAQIADREVRFTQMLGEAEGWVTLGPDDGELPLRARVRYSSDDAGITEEVVIEATGEIPSIARIGVRHGFVPDDWERIICGMRPVRAIPAAEETVFTYRVREGDVGPSRLDAWQSVMYPMTVLEGANAWVLVGSECLDDYVTIAPNRTPGYFPSLENNPLGIEEGDSFPFRITWRSFPKSEALLRDVWRSYAEGLFSANPLLSDLLPYEHPGTPRTLPPGIEVSAGGFTAHEGALIDASRVPQGANVWYFGWHDWVNERYPTEGSWWCRVGGWGKENAERLRDYLASYRAQGLKCYLYFRQIANLAQRGTVLPEDWFLTGAGGALDLYGGGYTLEASPEMAEEIGYTQIPWGMYDFSNDDFRAHYLQQVCDCMDFYPAAGIGWDMGWRPGNPGIVTVQAETFAWMREHHPERRIISNEATGSPTQWFADCVLVENGMLYGKTVLDYEVSKGFGTQIASIERGHQFRQVAERILAGKSNWPFAAGFEDARRFAAWSMETLALPEDEAARLNELAFRMNVRSGLRSLGLGAQWAYIPDASYGPRPVPERLIGLLTELMAVPPLQESFAVRLDGGTDMEGGLYASAWAAEDRLVACVFNDTDQSRPFTLEIDRAALQRHGCVETLGALQAFSVDWLAEVGEVQPQPITNNRAIGATGEIAPFTLLIYWADAVQ